MTTEPDLGQQADVYWLSADAMPRGGWAFEKGKFATVRDAVLFVMMALPERDRGSAWIATDSGNLNLGKIRELFETIE
jgi:hypothetical protein